MEFIDELKQFSKRVSSLKDSIQTEEATKTSLIMPFFALLGYDVFNPEEFVPEFTADVGIKKGEKVDYAVMKDGKPVILVEAKWAGEQLEKHDSQLFRYFGTTAAKFAVLTNGIVYRFYTDLDEPNKIDARPFLEINMLNVKPTKANELAKFKKTDFSIEDITSAASELKYTGEIQNKFASELQAPSDEFLRFFLNSVYSGVKTQAVMERFRPILKKALNDFISELMNEKIKTALNVEATQYQGQEQQGVPQETIPEAEPEEAENKIVTTTEELGAYFIIKMILKDTIPLQDITYKDTINYISILYKGKTTKWICRLILSGTRKILIIPDGNKKEIKISLGSIYEIEQYRAQLLEVVKRYQ